MKWPTDDWATIGPGYKVIKYTMTRPVKGACRVHARGIENVPLSGGGIVAVNHWSYWDPILVADAFPRPIVHLAKSELFRSRFGRWFFEDLGSQIPIDRKRGGNDVAFAKSVEAIEAGRLVGVYPEGTRSLPPDLLPGKTGVARLALATGAPVVPVGCLSDRFWSKRHSVPRFGQKVYVNVGRPITFPKDTRAAEDRETTRKVTDEIMAAVRSLLDDAAAARERGEAWPWKPRNGRLFG